MTARCEPTARVALWRRAPRRAAAPSATSRKMRFFLCAIALQRAASMVPPAACVARMDAFCNSDPKMAGCLTQIKAQGALLPLVALSDGSAAGTQPQWRCYSPTCLDASRTHYIRGPHTDRVVAGATRQPCTLFPHKLDCDMHRPDTYIHLYTHIHLYPHTFIHTYLCKYQY